MSLKSIAKAELLIHLWWLKNNRPLLVLWFLWPYLTALFILALGTAYGRIEEFRETMGIASPILYIFVGSAVVFASASIVDIATGIALWHRWIGTLTYIYLVPVRFNTYLVLSGVVGGLFMIVQNFAAIVPAIIILEGLSGGLRLLAVLGVMILGMVPLIGVAVVAAILTIAARVETNVVSFINPLLLLVSGIFYPVEILPRILRVLSDIVPVTYIVESAKLIATYAYPPGSTIVYIAAILATMALVYNSWSALIVSRSERYIRRRGTI